MYTEPCTSAAYTHATAKHKFLVMAGPVTETTLGAEDGREYYLALLDVCAKFNYSRAFGKDVDELQSEANVEDVKHLVCGVFGGFQWYSEHTWIQYVRELISAFERAGITGARGTEPIKLLVNRPPQSSIMPPAHTTSFVSPPGAVPQTTVLEFMRTCASGAPCPVPSLPVGVSWAGGSALTASSRPVSRIVSESGPEQPSGQKMPHGQRPQRRRNPAQQVRAY